MTSFPESVDHQAIKSLPREKMIAAIFQGTCALHEFAEKNVCPVIRAALQKSNYEQALAGTYYRMCLFLRALAKLDDTRHFQVAAMAARSVFELLLDLKALANNPTLSQKFFDFTWVSRYRKAKQLADFLRDNPAVDPAPHKQALDLVNKPGVAQNREQLCVKHGWANPAGKPTWPDHWSGKNIAARAKEAGTEYLEIYRSHFFIQSYYVHAGGAGIDSMSREALECAFAMNHLFIQRLFAEATKIVSEQFHLFDGDKSLRNRLEEASHTTAFFALQEALREPEGEDRK